MQIRITEANFNCEIQMSGSGVISPYDANEEMTASKAVLGRGRIQDFHMGGGGGRKSLCASTHITSAELNSLSAGVQGPLKGPDMTFDLTHLGTIYVQVPKDHLYQV